jgi:hypothetical protein
MICYLNGFDDAKEKLIEAKPLLKPYPQIYLSFKEAMRIFEMKYDLQAVIKHLKAMMALVT